jgi:hypothetical protein
MNEDIQYKIAYVLVVTVIVLAILTLIPAVIHVWAKVLS